MRTTKPDGGSDLTAAGTLETSDATDEFVVTLIGMTNGTLTEPVGALYAGRRDGLVRWAVALTGSFDLATDLVQDAFVALQANRHEVR